MKRITIYILIVLSLLSCSTQVTNRKPSSLGNEIHNFPQILETTRSLLIPVEKNLKDVPEHHVVDEFQNNPDLLYKERAELIKELESSKRSNLSPTSHTRLMPPKGMPGYSDLTLYVNHPYYLDDKLIKPHDLIQVWRDFILSAKKEIILNVFDFDLESIADALIQQAGRGLTVIVGIDKKSVIDVKPEVKTLYEKLLSRGVKVTGVVPVGLNHQKITAIDWSSPQNASVLFSSGNLTSSCLEPEGDLKGTYPLPKESVPNANHLITMKSWLLSNLVHHELIKTLDPGLLLRGKQQYPINGSYQITGPGVDPRTMEAYPHPSVVISFTPGGGLKSVNKNIISHFIKKEKGKIRMIQFAYSSNEVDKALLFRAEKDYQNTGKFDFLSIGDTPFAMREWSKFLIMSGLKKVVEGKKKYYLPDYSNPWYKSLGESRINDIQKKVFVAPKIYGNNWVSVNGKKVKVSAKIHHKIIATENYAILGSSFNFSEGAESNNEQILVFKDNRLTKAVDGMLKYLVENASGTVVTEADRRNQFGEEEEINNTPEDIAGAN
jgi:phosphatidylserine/phosphatidylglycerophosphate/cardiolipin synthase-like enzyme